MVPNGVPIATDEYKSRYVRVAGGEKNIVNFKNSHMQIVDRNLGIDCYI